MSYQFLKNVVLRGQIEVMTGLHIGGSKDKLEIGGVDSPVIRDPRTNQPYIPASSIKGKMRMLLEFALGKVDAKGEVFAEKDKDKAAVDPICRIFGTAEKEVKRGPTRLIIRDAFATKATVAMWEKLDTGLQYTEEKGENTINRLTSEANPRFQERVVKGSCFAFEIIYGIYDMGDGGKADLDNLKYVMQGLRLLQSAGLGGSVSRGYGQITITLADPVIVTNEDYRDGGTSYTSAITPPESIAYTRTLDTEITVS